MMGAYAFADLRELLSEDICQTMIEGMEAFGKKIKGFDRADAILAGVESRTSSPVRIPRNSSLESDVKGLFPCGEGAGYAGGITSAAMDGLRVAEEIGKRYAPFNREIQKKRNVEGGRHGEVEKNIHAGEKTDRDQNRFVFPDPSSDR